MLSNIYRSIKNVDLFQEIFPFFNFISASLSLGECPKVHHSDLSKTELIELSTSPCDLFEKIFSRSQESLT